MKFLKINGEGGTIMMPLEDTFWGARFGMLKDKFGVNWMFNHELKLTTVNTANNKDSESNKSRTKL